MEKGESSYRQTAYSLYFSEMKGLLELNGMKFHAFHGCLDFEREKGGEYEVDFSAEIDTTDAWLTDELASTLNYARVYDIVSAQMAKPSNLIENVAERIFHAIDEEFGLLEHFSVSVSKLNPPVSGETDRARITLKK